jgi:hypothetical protein
MNDSTGPGPSAEQTASEGNPNPTAHSSHGCVCGGKGPALSQMLEMILPSAAAGEHFRNARLEMLKGFRELLDQRIQSLSEKQNKGTKLNVE